MAPDPSRWSPLEVDELHAHLATFRNWCLCGGRSLDWVLGHSTRTHGDTDIGVFRSELPGCLEEIGISRIFLCRPSGATTPWDGGEVPQTVHDVWVTDPAGRFWVFQILVFDDEGDEVIYRRDPRIRWRKSEHAITVRGVPVLNPAITLLFKTNRSGMEEKDCRDVQAMINWVAATLAQD